MNAEQMREMADALVADGRLTAEHADVLVADGKGAYLQMISMGLLYDVDAPANVDRRGPAEKEQGDGE